MTVGHLPKGLRAWSATRRVTSRITRKDGEGVRAETRIPSIPGVSGPSEIRSDRLRLAQTLHSDSSVPAEWI